MKEYTDLEEACAALREGWVIEPSRWTLREKTVEDYVEQWEFDEDAVTVTFQTTAGLETENLTDSQLIEFGRALVTMASAARGQE